MPGVDSDADIKTCWAGMDGYALIDHAEYVSMKKQIKHLKEEIERLKVSAENAPQR
jgi:hypothetical protein